VLDIAHVNLCQRQDEADYYGGALEDGGVLVTVDADGRVERNEVGAILAQYGGRAYTR
jgi:hypothetical protein